MKRILHVSEVSAGGVLALVRDYVADQQRRGYEVHVAGASGLDFGPCTFHPWAGSRRRPHLAMVDVWALRRIVARVRPDVVHLHSFFAGLFGRLPGVVKGAAIVYQPHSWAFNATTSSAGRLIVVATERAATRATHLTVTNCVDEIIEGREAGVRGDARSIGVPVDLDHFSPPDPAARIRAKEALGLGDRRVVVCVGRICRQKGQDLLVPAWERRPVSSANLYVVGGGDPSSLVALAPRTWGRSVYAIGHTADIRTWWHAADVMVLPSRYEGQSVAVSEALACGVPVVAFAVNGVRAAVADGGGAAGEVVPLGDTDRLLSAVSLRVADPMVRAAESEAGRRRALRDSQPADVLDRLVDSYKAAVALAGRSR